MVALGILCLAMLQLPLSKYAMRRWRGSSATELASLPVGPHSPSIRQEGFLC